MSEEESSSAAGAPAWMATFADMMSLLLTFFVLLLSFANLDVVKFRDALGSLKNAFGVTFTESGPYEGQTQQLVELSEETVARPDPSGGDDAAAALNRELLETVQNVIDERELDNVMQAVIGERGVTIRASGKLMFRAASEQLADESLEVLQEIADLAALFPHMISVEGHTDDQPIQTERFPSNWELSAARAVAGVRFLIDEGYVEAGRISAAGFAHTRPVVDGASPQARGRNRRIEFVFYRDQAAEAAALDLSEGAPGPGS